ncbi:MAG: thioesterase [Lachnospiraceae bacterium]|nr:thioesterase [Lachnospiraceae bacterium]
MVSQMFCLPYAGGSASIYNDWVKKLKSSIDVCPIEYAGHGGRFCEEFYFDIEEAAQDVSKMIRKRCKEDYVIYGHSMGCLVALETAFVLEKEKAVLPKAIIVGGNRPPHLKYKDKSLKELSKDELMEETASLGQIEPEVMECEELYEIIADIMYADVQMFSKYDRSPEWGKISIPVLVLAGDGDDETPMEDIQEWKEYTNGEFKLNVFKGNHFFAFNDNEAFFDYLLKYIEKL